MKIDGQLIVQGAFAVAGLAVVYGVYKGVTSVGEAVDSVKSGWQKFKDGLTFDPASLGPDIQRPDGAQSEFDRYLELGYIDKQGNITPQGEAYITWKKQFEAGQ